MADTLISIGDFSRMTYLTVKALRYYHEEGVLEPQNVDPSSGYRRYAPSQVPIAQVIRRLRELDMPIDEVRAVVRAPSVDERNRTIAAHLERMEQQLAETRQAVQSLRSLLQPSDGRPRRVEYRVVPAEWTLAVRGRIPMSNATAWNVAAFADLASALERAGLMPSGPPGSLYYPDLFEEGVGEIVSFVRLAERPTAVPAAGVELFQTPATELAIMVHSGSFDDIDRTFGALGSWVSERAIGVSGPIWENYLISDAQTSDRRRHRTEVGWPVFRVAEADTDGRRE